MKIFALALALLVSAPAFAYLPPAFYVYGKIAEQKAKTPVSGVAITVARPQGAGTEETLGSLTINEWRPVRGGWPTLSLIFSGESSELIRAVTAFGLTVTPETELLRVDRARLSAMKEPPHPFYKVDRTMQLKRARQTYAWVHTNEAAGLSVWVEKDTLLPLKIAGPCPAGAGSLAWAKAGENKCELEFRNLGALRRGNLQSTRLTLWKDGSPLLFFTFDRVASGKTRLPVSTSPLPPEVKDIAEVLLH